MIDSNITLFSANARKNQDGVVSDSVVYFSNQVATNISGPAPLKLRKIVDLVSLLMSYGTK